MTVVFERATQKVKKNEVRVPDPIAVCAVESPLNMVARPECRTFAKQSGGEGAGSRTPRSFPYEGRPH